MDKLIFMLLVVVFIFYSLSCTPDQNASADVDQRRPAGLTATERSASASSASNDATFDLQEGDLLFADEDCGPFCDAIEKVTHGVDGAKFSHVGLVIQNPRKQLVVMEAIRRGVITTPIDSFLLRSKDEAGRPKILVGRLKELYRNLIPAAANYVKERLGKDYDQVFNINNDQYYCSELLYFAFKEANQGTPVFQLRPMTFKDPDTQATFPIWKEYFDDLGELIPEHQPGLNPGSMSRSLYIDIVHAYGIPSGYRPK